jgi:hypothetical protein
MSSQPEPGKPEGGDCGLELFMSDPPPPYQPGVTSFLQWMAWLARHAQGQPDREAGG